MRAFKKLQVRVFLVCECILTVGVGASSALRLASRQIWGPPFPLLPSGCRMRPSLAWYLTFSSRPGGSTFSLVCWQFQPQFRVSVSASTHCKRFYETALFFFLNIRGIFVEKYPRNNSVCFKERAISWHCLSVGLLMKGACWQQRWLFLPVELSRLGGEEKIYLHLLAEKLL